MLKPIEIDLEFQPYSSSITAQSGELVTAKALYQRSCTNDDITISSWKDTWIKQYKENHDRVGSFSDNGVGKLYNSQKLKPCIVIGSGPSLANNILELRNTHGISKISCLHNFHYLEDNEVEVDYYVTLDAGDICIEEVHEGGQRKPEEYWSLTKGKTLIAFASSSPKLIEKWQGEILWYNAPIPSPEIAKAFNEIEEFHTYISNGGNVLGACLYIAKAILGCNPVIFCGADFAFGYAKQFHPWKSKYDGHVGQGFKHCNVFGIYVYTWASYYNFKCWFESRAMSVPGIFINATEGGIFGSYPGANIDSVKQMSLNAALNMYNLNDPIRTQCENSKQLDNVILF